MFQIKTAHIVVLALFFSPIIEAQNYCPDTPDSSHFKDNGNGTVTDYRTSLTWKKCSEGQTGNDCSGTPNEYTWQQALTRAGAVNNSGGFAGYRNWRLPSLQELRSIATTACRDPSIDLSVFPNTERVYWTDEAHGSYDTTAFAFDYHMMPGGADRPQTKTNYNSVRLVR